MYSNIKKENGKATAISELEFYAQSLLFAELSMIAYQDSDTAEAQARSIGFETSEYFDVEGAQAYLFTTEHDQVIACRGTQPTQLNDLGADLYALPVKSRVLGRVHAGFRREADKVWPLILPKLDSNKRTWFTGHSLGAAMTTLCAARYQSLAVNAMRDGVAGLFTYGSPRAGWRGFVKHNRHIPHYRWVNNSDIVTKVPLLAMGYVHHGTICYFNTWGNHRNYTWSQRFKDRYRATWRGLLQGRPDPLSDHNIGDYVEHLYRCVIGEEYPQDKIVK